jgi:hypothetical protein
MQQLVALEIEHQATAAKTAKCEETCVVNIPTIAGK